MCSNCGIIVATVPVGNAVCQFMALLYGRYLE